MKILHVITSLRTGGAEKLMVDLLPRMKAMGAEVDLCVFDGVRTPFYEELEKKGVRIISLGTSVYSPFNILRLLKLMRKYDVVHTHNTACQYYAAIAGLWTKCKKITTEHNTTNRRRQKRGWLFWDRWMYGRYDKVICISKETRENLLHFLYDVNAVCVNDKYVTIYNGIDVANYASSNNVSNTGNGHIHVILMVGAFRWEKDQKTIVRALQHLGNEYRVWFVGGGSKELRDECELLAKELGVDERTLFWGERSDVKDLLLQASVVVQSSHVDGFCLAAVEGMASGKPVVVSDIPGVGDIVGGYGVLFPHEDAQTLAGEIRKLCENEGYCKEVVKRCQERARMFDIGVMVERYMDLYQDGSERKTAVLPSYSVAIRTLGLAGEAFRRELVSLYKQTVKPQKVVIYIAEGYECPDWRVGNEEYVYVRKGMVAQRALRYDEIETEYVLLLDDDVELQEDYAERLLRAMAEVDADCVGGDTYKNQDMPLWQKLYAVAVNLVFPHWDRKWAFRIHGNGSFSYLNRTDGVTVLPTQYVAGPCAMWKKKAIGRLHWREELWVDNLEFSYMEDTVLTYKLHVNGGRLYLLYGDGAEHLNAQTSSGHYRSRAVMFYTRARQGFCVWWRSIYEVSLHGNDSRMQTWLIVLAYVLKVCWLAVMNVVAGICYLNAKIPCYYVRGLVDGWKFVHSDKYRKIERYKL